MWYSIFGGLFILGVLLIAAGLVCYMGVEGFNSISDNAGSAFALIVIFAIIIVSFSDVSGLIGFIDTLCGGIPLLNDIADVGSIGRLFKKEPLTVVRGFLDIVLLSTLVEFLVKIDKWLRKRDNEGIPKEYQKPVPAMVQLLTMMVTPLVALFILNYVIKTSEVYRAIAEVFAAIISLISFGIIPLTIANITMKKVKTTVMFIMILMAFYKSIVVRTLLSAAFKALVLFGALFVLDFYRPQLAQGMTTAAQMVSAVMPCIIIFVTIIVLVKGVLFNKK